LTQRRRDAVVRHPVGLSVHHPGDQARRCLEELLYGGNWRPAAQALLQGALAEDQKTAEAASQALFRDVVEPLADSFEPSYSEIYRDFFSWVIEAVRRRPGFEELDAALGRVGPGSCAGATKRIRRIVVPSRVTLGADIAVVSVILDGLLERFPDAEIHFAGSAKNTDLFSGAPRLHPLPAPYPRGGALRQRLAVWPELLRLVEGQRQGLGPGELLVVDPDSRMTQLGLLPLGPAGEPALFYDSRAFGAAMEPSPWRS
jgi:hypothetical protein